MHRPRVAGTAVARLRSWSHRSRSSRPQVWRNRIPVSCTTALSLWVWFSLYTAAWSLCLLLPLSSSSVPSMKIFMNSNCSDNSNINDIDQNEDAGNNDNDDDDDQNIIIIISMIKMDLMSTSSVSSQHWNNDMIYIYATYASYIHACT